MNDISNNNQKRDSFTLTEERNSFTLKTVTDLAYLEKEKAYFNADDDYQEKKMPAKSNGPSKVIPRYEIPSNEGDTRSSTASSTEPGEDNDASRAEMSKELTEDMDDPFDDIESFLAQAKEKVHAFTEEELSSMTEADVKKQIVQQRDGYSEKLEAFGEKSFAEKNLRNGPLKVGATFQKHSDSTLAKKNSIEMFQDEDSQISHFSNLMRETSLASAKSTMSGISMDGSQPGAFRTNGINSVPERDEYARGMKSTEPSEALMVEAIKVDENEEDSSNAERIREQIIQQSVEAMAVHVMPEEEDEKREVMCKVRAIIAAFLLAIVGVVVALVMLGFGKKANPAIDLTPQQRIYGSTWLTYGERIIGHQGASNFGESVDVSGDAKVLAVGAYEGDGGTGSVRVMQYMPTTEWTQLGNKVEGHFQGEKFGSDVQLSRDGSILIVAGIGSSKFGQGHYGHVSVYEYQRLSNQWVQVGDSVQGEYKGDRFGISLSAASNGLSWIVGGDNDRHDDNERERDGYARVYELFQGQWRQKGRTIKGSNGSWTAKQYAVAMSGDGQTVCVGDNKYIVNDEFRPGRARCFRWWEQDNDWRSLGGELIGKNHWEQYGYSLSLNEDGTRVAISSARYGPGSVRVYELVDGLWSLKGEPLTGDNDADQMGFKVALNKKGDVLAYSGRGFDMPTKNNTGVVRVRRWINDEWQPLGSDIYGYREGDYFGENVVLGDEGTTLVASANWARTTGVQYVNAFILA